MSTYKNSGIIRQETARCFLCHNAPCTKACNKGLDPAGFIRSLRFDNFYTASAHIEASECAQCDAPCEKACAFESFPIQIKALTENSIIESTSNNPGVDLAIDFCGIRCENPFFLSSSIVASSYDMCANALELGWGGIVYKTIGTVSVNEVSPRFDAIRKEGTPFIGFRNLEQIADHPLEQSLEDLRRLKRNYPTKVIIASIMGQNAEEWTKLAELVTDAGAHMIECNFSCPHMNGHGLGSDVGQDPELVRLYTEYTRRGTHLPILAKMTPNLGNMEIPALAAIEGGADGLAAINTIKSITGLRLKRLEAPTSVERKTSVSGYSGKAVKPIALRFIHDLAKHMENVPLSGMGGIETWHDAAEFLALGCSNVQITTAVMQYGYRIIDDLTEGLSRFLFENGYQSLEDFVGTALPNLLPADELDRDTVEYPKFESGACVGCGRCYLSCRDAGHQAITFDGTDRTPVLSGGKCVGCHLCLLVCPSGAISTSKRVCKPVNRRQ